jgi:hypothetical protein
METIPFYKMNPSQNVVTNGFCLAEPGKQYLVYLPAKGSVDVKVETGKTYAFTWINGQNPLKDQRFGGTTSTGQNLTSPADGDDWLVYLTLENGSTKLTGSTTLVTSRTHDGNVPANTLDGSLATRWSAKGDNQWIRYDLGTTKTVTSVKIAWYKGNKRKAYFQVQVSPDTINWTTLFSGISSGTSLAMQPYNIKDGSGRYLRIVGDGNTSNAWNSITELEIYGYKSSSAINSSSNYADKPEVNIYPLPVESILQVELDGAKWSGAQVQITDLYGDLLLSHKLEIKDSVLEIDMQDKPAGIYLLTIILGQERYTRRIIKL